MTRVLFWNLGKREVASLVATAAREHDADILVLAECAIEVVPLLVALNEGRSQMFGLVNGAPHRLLILSRLPTGWVEPVMDDAQVSVRRVRSLLGSSFLLVCAHLASKMFQSDDDQADLAQRLAATIREEEKREGHTRTVVVGDLNMNPFERGVVGSEGLHAVMDRRVALRGSRVVQGVAREFFYNPMWGRLGDDSVGPPGTYFSERASPFSLFWNTFDQVLLRPALLPYFDAASLAVPTTVGAVSLLRHDGTPDTKVGSDHLPLVFSLDMDRGSEMEVNAT